MCQNAQKTLMSLMAAIEPSIVNLGTAAGIESNSLFQDVINEYNVALTAVENWQSGTPAQDAIQLINDLEAGVQALPIPVTVQTLVDIILAGIATVIGVLSANSPVPIQIGADGDATQEETQAQHQAEVINETTAKVEKLVPGFKRSIWHSAATQYKNAWNSEIKALNLAPTLQLA